MDRKALLQFFWVTGGKAWTVRDGWIDNASDLGRWFGVVITAGGRVVELTLTTGLLRGNNLGGEGVERQCGDGVVVGEKMSGVSLEFV